MKTIINKFILTEKNYNKVKNLEFLINSKKINKKLITFIFNFFIIKVNKLKNRKQQKYKILIKTEKNYNNLNLDFIKIFN